MSEDYLSDIKSWEKAKKKRDSYPFPSKGKLSKNDKEAFDTLFKKEDEQYNHIKGKYKISKPYTRDFLERVAQGITVDMDVFNYRGHRAVRQVLLGGGDGVFRGKTKILKSPQGGHRGVQVDWLCTTPDNNLIVEIDTTANRKDIHFHIDELLDLCSAEFEIKKEDTRLRDSRIRDIEVYRLRALKKTKKFPVLDKRGMETGEYRQTVKEKPWEEIGAEVGMTGDAARKARGRVYKKIHGIPYKAGTKVKVEKTFLNKDCSTCEDRPSCKKICPEMLLYAHQNWGERDKASSDKGGALAEALRNNYYGQNEND
jgi:hypothetical protein